MNTGRLLLATILAGAIAAPIGAMAEDKSVAQQTTRPAVKLPIEGEFPSLGGATAWLNSPPLSPADLRGKVVLLDVWTYTCINWLRTLPYVRAWADKYKDHGLVVIGVHSPEFPFEHDVDNVRLAVRDMAVDYPVALDNDYAVWRAFSNHYWPAVYIADSSGRIRHHQFGEGGYEECESIIQQLLRDAGDRSIADDLVSVAGEGFEAQADWTNLKTPETYLGHDQTQNFASAGGADLGRPRTYVLPDRLSLNHWALSGDWTLERGASVLNSAAGSIAFRFHARDLHLVVGAEARGASLPFNVLLDGEPPGAAHGLDVDDHGNGVVSEPRLYQLIRQPAAVTERTFEITFHEPGVAAYAFTFG
jgi:thiol-disulfide isomerase/thioredoxin